MLRVTTIFIIFILGAVFGSFGGIKQVFTSEESLNFKDSLPVTVSASGKAEWFYHDNTILTKDKFGTPLDPAGTDIVPLENRKISEDQKSYTHLHDGMIFSFVRTMVTGSIILEAIDLTPFDMKESKDLAVAEANFQGPDGENFKVVLKRLIPPQSIIQAFGGVGVNHLIHGHSGLGNDGLFSEFAYVVIFGFADIYREEELIAEDRFLYIAASERARVLNEDVRSGNYNVSRPTGNLIIHLVVLPYDSFFEDAPVPTGVIGPDGSEQNFFHVNFLENIEISGNRFFR